MEKLKRNILEQGVVLDHSILRVDRFLNHQIDPILMNEIGKEFSNRFKKDEITKVLTIEASGIAPAIFTAFHLNVPIVFAKKRKSVIQDEHVYQTSVFSYTKKETYQITVECMYIDPLDRVLIIDDFLAAGEAVSGLSRIVDMAKAKLMGVGIVIEKGFQHGGDNLRKTGLKVESLAIIDEMSTDKIIFRENVEERP